jgi:hypothetical protein
MPEGDMVPIAKAFPTMMVAMEHTIKGSAVGNQREAIEVRRIGFSKSFFPFSEAFSLHFMDPPQTGKVALEIGNC